MSPGQPHDFDADRRRLEKLEADIQRAERRHREEYRREHPFGEHPGGLGATLGGDLGRPNPGHDLPPGSDDDDD